MEKPDRPLYVEVDPETMRVLYGLHVETGRPYGSILSQSLMLYRAFLRGGKEPASRVPRGRHRGGPAESVGEIAKRAVRARK